MSVVYKHTRIISQIRHSCNKKAISKLIINKVIKPLKRLKKLAEKTAEYDLKDKENFNDIISRRVEIRIITNDKAVIEKLINNSK